MSDDLIEKLYDRRVCSPAQNSCRNDWLLNQCRDRIEEMEAKLATCEKYRDAYAECDRIATQAVRDLEAKLAKAMEYISKDAARIEHVVSKIQFRSGHDSMATQTWVNGWLYEASSIIAGLTGGKDE